MDSSDESEPEIVESDQYELDSEDDPDTDSEDDYKVRFPMVTPPNGFDFDSEEDDERDPDIAEGRSATDIQSQIWRVLSNLEASSTFTVGDHPSASPNPGLHIPDRGIVGLPLSQEDAKTIISKSRQSPFGKKEETIVDTTVRNSWELDASEFSLENPEWGKEIQRYVSLIYTAFGLTCGQENVAAELYKLLLYEPGAFFKPHKDSEKVLGMFATLIVCLPSVYEGGTLILQHGTEVQEFRTASASAFGTSWAAWYSDVTHQVTPLISGYRLVLTYNLIRKSAAQNYTLVAPNLGGYKSKLSELLKVYDERLDNDEDLPAFLIHKLKHKYTHGSLKGDSLKGQDAAQLQALVQATRNIGYRLYLATLELQFVKEIGEESDRSQDLKNVVHLDGNPVAPYLETPDYAVIDPHREDEYSYDEVEEEGWTGNEGAIERFWYRDAAMVIVPPTGYPNFVTTPRYPMDEALSLLRTLKGKCGTDMPDETPQQRQLTRLYQLVLKKVPRTHPASWLNYPSSEDHDTAMAKQLFDEAAIIALEANNMLEFEIACTYTNGRVIVKNAKHVGSALTQTGLARIKPLLEQAVMTLLDLESRRRFLQELKEGIKSCTSSATVTDLEEIQRWSDDMIVQVAFESGKARREDGITLAKISEILYWDYFESTVMQRFPTTATVVRIAFINEFLRRRSSQLDQAQRGLIEKAIEQTWESFSFSLPPPTTKKQATSTRKKPPFSNLRYSIKYGFSSASVAPTSVEPVFDSTDLLTGEDLNDFLQNSVSLIPSKTFEEYIVPKLLVAIPKAPSEVCSITIIQFIKLILEDKCSLFHLQTSSPAPTQPQKALVQSLVAAYISNIVGPRPKKPTTWSMPKVKCACNDCQVINKFLTSRVQKEFDFPCNKERRKHLDSVFKDNDEGSYKIMEIRKGIPYTWRIVKTESGFRRALKKWEQTRSTAKMNLSSVAQGGSAQDRLKAYLDPHYKVFMEANVAKLPEIQISQPLGEVDGNIGAVVKHNEKSRKRDRGSSSATSEGMGKKRPKLGNEGKTQADENATADVEIVDLTDM